MPEKKEANLEVSLPLRTTKVMGMSSSEEPATLAPLSCLTNRDSLKLVPKFVEKAAVAVGVTFTSLYFK